MIPFISLTESMFLKMTEEEFLGLMEATHHLNVQDLYKEVSDIYATVKQQMNEVKQILFDAVYMVVLLQQYQPEIDLLGAFWNTYNINSGVLDVHPILTQAAKALNRHVLSTGNYSSIEEYLAEKNLQVKPTWATLSTESGYPISSEFVESLTG